MEPSACKKKRSFIITKFEHLLCAGSDEAPDSTLTRFEHKTLKKASSLFV